VFKKILLTLLPLALVAGGWHFLQNKNSAPVTSEPTAGNTTASRITSEQTTLTNPLATEKDDATLIVDEIKNESTSSNSNSTDNSSAGSVNTSETAEAIINSTGNDIDAASVAVEPLSDAEFIRLEQQIKSDRSLRMQLLEEFRYNTDPARAQQLAALIGPYNDPEIVKTASELAYSGDIQSQIAGLDLLSRVQPRNDEARDVAIDLLSSGNDPQLLIATMNVLATPSKNATADQRQLLNDNLGNLANHYDPAVRSQSLSLMGRWDKNSSTARESLTRGLTDRDPDVRSSAAFAVKGIRNPDNNVIDGLLFIAEKTDEKKSARYAALSALEQIQLAGNHLRRYTLAKRNVNRR